MTSTDYAALLTNDTPERRLLSEVTWALDAQHQPLRGLTSSLLFESRRFAEAKPETLFSIVTPLHDTPPRYLEEVVACCRLQSWSRWELLLVDDGSVRREHLPVARRLAASDPRIRLMELPSSLGISGARNAGIAEARGDYVGFLDHDDLLHPATLGLVATVVAHQPDVDLVFSNEAKIGNTSREVSEFLSKPEFDLFTLLRVNYVAHFMVLRRSALLALHVRDGEFFRSRFDGVEDHDLVLRLALHRPRTAHLAHFLYYWRHSPSSTASSPTAKPALEARGLELRREHLTTLHGPGTFEVLPPNSPEGHTRFSVKLTVPASTPAPTLTVVVPFRDQAEFTLRCLAALERQEHSLDLRVVLVDNGSIEASTGAKLSAWLSSPRRNRYQLVRDAGAFNFARINNDAVREHARGSDLLLFLNNDVELRTIDCLETLAGHLLRDPSCGFAGVRLLYPGGDVVQHGGVRVCESFGGSGYYGIGHARRPEEFVRDEHVTLGVTFACAMTRGSTFEALGGLEERAFPNGFGDVDICLRAIEAGLRNHYFGTLVGIHHEGITRGLTCEDGEFAALHERHGATIARWRLRQLCYDLQPRWVERTRDQRPEEAVLPLRYQIADRLNYRLKLALGPLHESLKARLARRSRDRALRRLTDADDGAPNTTTTSS